MPNYNRCVCIIAQPHHKNAPPHPATSFHPPLEKGPEEQPPGDSPSRRSPSLSPFPFFVQSESVSLSDFSPSPLSFSSAKVTPVAKTLWCFLLPSFLLFAQSCSVCTNVQRKGRRLLEGPEKPAPLAEEEVVDEE